MLAAAKCCKSNMGEYQDYVKQLTPMGSKPMTWHQMKEFVNSLSVEQLQQPVIAWGDGFVNGVFNIDVITEDCDASDDHIETVRQLKEDDKTYEPEPEFLIPAGTLRLSCG